MDEEAALKKQLETCEDFEERRDIRKKLREFRQKRMDEPNPEPSGRSGRSSRRKEYKEETTTKSSDGVTVTETHTTKKEIVENGDVVTSEERVEVSSKVEDEAAPDDEPEPEPEAEPEQEPEQEQEPEPELEEAEAEAPEETPQEEESENVPPYMQKNPENLTEQEIEEIDDLDFLETTLKQLAIKFFDVRKYLRARIRKVKVSQAKGRAEAKQRGAASKSQAQPSRVQGPQINIEDKSQLSALRSQIEQQKKEKEAGGSYSSTTTKTTEIRGGAGGSTTITKTTTTRGGIGAKAGMRNFEAEMSKKKKERQNAKAEAFKNAKDKRSAFKDQLEASNPKPAGGVKKSFDKPNTAVNALLEWCRRKTRGYENVDLQNYTTSWANGLAMCALFHNFAPENVPWETLDPKDRKRNWTLAFEAAYKEGMDPILELEDVLCTPVPEPRSLITYVHSIYSHFHEKAEKAKAEKEAKNA